MDLIRLFTRLALMARRRQSTQRLIMISVVLALCLAVAGLQWLGLAPDWMTATRPGRLLHGL